MTIITEERACEIRGQLCERHGAQWLHEYHKAIEAEVAKALGEQRRDLALALDDMTARFEELRCVFGDRPPAKLTIRARELVAASGVLS